MHVKQFVGMVDILGISQLTGWRWTVLPWYMHATTENGLHRESGPAAVYQYQYQATLQQGLFPTLFQTSILLIPYHE